MSRLLKIGTIIVVSAGGLCSTASCRMDGGAGGNAEESNGGDVADGEHGIAGQALEASVGHPKCSTGDPLSTSTDPCVKDICAAHPECCDTAWDSACVGYVSTVCGLNCNFGFTMSPGHSSLCLGFSSGTCGGGTLVQLPCTGANLQRFLVTEDPVAVGTYRIRNKSTDLCLTVGAQGALVKQQACDGSASQRFTLDYGAGHYRLINELNGNCLKVSEGGTAGGVPVVSAMCQNKAEQRVRFDF